MRTKFFAQLAKCTTLLHIAFKFIVAKFSKYMTIKICSFNYASLPWVTFRPYVLHESLVFGGSRDTKKSLSYKFRLTHITGGGSGSHPGLPNFSVIVL